MKHAELLQDQTSLERGDEFMRLFEECNAAYFDRALQISDPDADFSREALRWVDHAVGVGWGEDKWSELGQRLITLRQRNLEKQTSPEFRAGKLLIEKIVQYRPINDFMMLHYNAPIAVRRSQDDEYVIQDH